jgi:hypothetical protein
MSIHIFWFPLRVMFKNCFWLQLGPDPHTPILFLKNTQHKRTSSYTHILFVLKNESITWVFIYKILCSLFRIDQHQDFFWAQQIFQCRDSNLDQLWVTPRFLMLELWSRLNLCRIKKLASGLSVLIMELIDSVALNQNFWRRDSNRD